MAVAVESSTTTAVACESKEILMTWYDRLLRLTANWHWDANAQLLCLGSAEAVSVRGARADPEFWSNMNAVPVLHGL